MKRKPPPTNKTKSVEKGRHNDAQLGSARQIQE